MKKGKLFIGLVTGLAAMVTLSGCDTTEAAAEIAKIKEKLIPSWTSLVVQFGALVILIFIVIFCAYKPVKKMVKKRQDYIENNIRDSEVSKAVALKAEKQSSEIVLESKKQAAQIIEEAQNAAKKDRENLLNEARLEVTKMKSDAEMDIERSKQEALDEIHAEMVDVALAASSEILKREVNKKDNARLTEEFIENLD